MQQSEIAETTSTTTNLHSDALIYRCLDRYVLAALERALSAAKCGRLQVTMPSGLSTVIGAEGEQGIDADIVLNNYGMFRKSVRRGALGFAESYMAGDFDTDQLGHVFEFYMDNEEALLSSFRRFFRSAWLDKMFHARRRNTRSGSRENIAAHYDLGNDFYRLWLDGSMSYSSGIYQTSSDTLEQSQDEKYRRILAALELSGGEDILEIGCGWGGFAEAAAQTGANVTGITISQEQYAAAIERLSKAKLQGTAEILFQDYRDTKGSFDRIASIEMIEAVGEENWETYFQVVSQRLRSGGIAVLQAITIREDLYEDYRNNPDFIQRYIFPGGMLPTVTIMQRHAERAGLQFEVHEQFGQSYAKTLADWRSRFVDMWPRIEALGFDDRFRRMWMYYLDYCEVGFARGTIDVGLFRLRKPTNQNQEITTNSINPYSLSKDE